jgi:hypothetical protein
VVTKTKYYVLGNFEKELNGGGGNIRDLHYIRETQIFRTK